MKPTNELYAKLPEITFRMSKTELIQTQIRNADDCAELFRKLYDESIEVYESMFAIFLDRANKTIGWLRVSQGGISGTVIDIRLILKAAINCLASNIILCHNHPSGNSQPSGADTQITKKISEGAKLLDIHVLDHIILTSDSYFSFANEGLI